MSVYDELMNESPFSRPTAGRSGPRTQLSMNPEEEAEFRRRGENPSPERGVGDDTRRAARTMGGTPQQRLLQHKRYSGSLAAKTTASFVRPGTHNYLQRRAPERQAAGTTYEGPSLREKVEYIRSFLESRTTRREPHRRGDTGRGRNRASRTRMKPYVRNKRRRGGPPPHREEQPKFGTVFPRDTEDAPTTDDSRQKNWNKRNNK